MIRVAFSDTFAQFSFFFRKLDTNDVNAEITLLTHQLFVAKLIKESALVAGNKDYINLITPALIIMKMTKKSCKNNGSEHKLHRRENEKFDHFLRFM